MNFRLDFGVRVLGLSWNLSFLNFYMFGEVIH